MLVVMVFSFYNNDIASAIRMVYSSVVHKREGGSMQLTEKHIIDRNDPRYAVIDTAAFQSKNLYNAALYEMRQPSSSKKNASPAHLLTEEKAMPTFIMRVGIALYRHI
jgi:hypothetical protein